MDDTLLKMVIVNLIDELDAVASAPSEGPLPISVARAEGGILTLLKLKNRLGLALPLVAEVEQSAFDTDDSTY